VQRVATDDAAPTEVSLGLRGGTRAVALPVDVVAAAAQWPLYGLERLRVDLAGTDAGRPIQSDDPAYDPHFRCGLEKKHRGPKRSDDGTENAIGAVERIHRREGNGGGRPGQRIAANEDYDENNHEARWAP
jgi:hypothetical protein